MSIYRLLFRSVLTRIDPETAHRIAARTTSVLTRPRIVRDLMRRALGPKDPGLRVRALGVEFPSPLGVAAGFDKEATWYDGLCALGFGFVEVGTVTAQPQAGNDRPRVFRLTRDHAVVNRMGFPNPGAAAVAQQLRRRPPQDVVAVNVGKTRVVGDDQVGEDYRSAVRQLAPHAKFLVLNVSSPNTPGLRALQSTARLAELIDDVRAELRDQGVEIPLLVKIAPDLADEEIDAIADLALSKQLDGLIAINTTIARDGLESDPAQVEAIGAGGVSGRPLKGRALEVLRRLRARTGDQLVLISVGGIETAQDAWDRIVAGATLVQAHTGFVYGGPLWPSRINRGLSERLRATGRTSIQELVGSEARAAAAGRAQQDSSSLTS